MTIIITDINNNVISSFYFGEAFKSENADKILKQSEETILNLICMKLVYES